MTRPKQNVDSFGEQEARQRLADVLRGAFSGPPTPLKAIPKRNGESRRMGVQPKPARKARKATAPKSA